RDFVLDRVHLVHVHRAAPRAFRSDRSPVAGAPGRARDAREIESRRGKIESEPDGHFQQMSAKNGWKTREEMEGTERAMLAPFAQKSGESRGRKYSEKSHAYRTEFQRDRARIIHSRAFRRLEYKTQVFLNGTGDHLRTRLTHSIEVASISRTIARALGLNEDLAEAIALAHDLGHAP